ncbi:MAG: AAA family ATPase [Acaryochloridaceae cyanobacterium RU_4_10]|nr:AAA family ATPase [Acaryochloridaceae cyanobacterium RU_4_10]
MNNCPIVWVVIGVSGSGKTSVGRLFAKELECDFLEGDRRHPLSNVKKMNSRQPLAAEDRLPWLLELENDIRQAIGKNRETVMTCSALKASYRKQLTSLGRVQLVWLDVPISVLKQRLEARPKHYMRAEMLNSQMAAFEPIPPEENAMIVNGDLPLDTVVSELMAEVIRRFPSMEKPWWERCME